MSFLTRSVPKTTSLAAPISRIAAVRSTRPFTTSRPAQKIVPETVKDGLHKVDRAVSDKLVDGINMATAASHKVMETAEDLSSSGVAEQVEGMQAHAKGKAQEMKGTAKEMKGTAKGKAEELKGKTKGAAAEAKGKAKETAEDVQSNLYD
ncbi:hypothetical protein BBK36DRAFT_1173001 [Trichoderma citrinoviride]|uniref:LEA domain-containing protein n=1 Tax=Trichoderma citrinoviride TaxID=58853 RepID=A0A2T4AXY2_9HYPO|nr:hypothetical protein BBK36DRAFT_1173001 [Trichoderma citrinoviride]PTB61935.1 hypothetical protein BBK36DRAFT_1173001 [Trichoderma citrinoviride]